jgi:hypothetical protein
VSRRGRTDLMNDDGTNPVREIETELALVPEKISAWINAAGPYSSRRRSIILERGSGRFG